MKHFSYLSDLLYRMPDYCDPVLCDRIHWQCVEVGHIFVYNSLIVQAGKSLIVVAI